MSGRYDSKWQDVAIYVFCIAVLILMSWLLHEMT